jgi:hypothetical protein
MRGLDTAAEHSVEVDSLADGTTDRPGWAELSTTHFAPLRAGRSGRREGLLPA